MSSNDATFHARITADAKQFVAEMQGAAAALSALVKQAESAGKGATNVGRSDAKKATNEIQDVYKAAMKASDVAAANEIENQKKISAARKGVAASSGSDSFFRPQQKFSRALGPVRDDRQGALDTKQLQDTLRLTQQLTEAERQRATLNKVHGMALLEDRRRMNKIHLDAIAEDKKRTAMQRTALRKELDSMVTGRYALYDQAAGYELVAQKMMVFAAAMASTIAVAGQFETAFTSVDRALQPLPDELEGIKQSLVGLSQELPITFAEMSKIATLGAQMGVTAGGIEDFTRNVSSFAAVTGASIDETASRFGRISALANIDSSDFDKLGSAVAYTGINAVATEQEILALTESIAAATTNAGFAADETIGLATTLASLGIAPEQSRGVILRVFSDITRAADKGGQEIAAFGEVMGLSGEQAATLWKTDSSAFFKRMLDGIGTAENFTATMDKLGFTETRETNVLQRLSQNMGIYDKSMQDANKSYEEGSFLGDAYAKTADNLEAKFTILINSLTALSDTIGSGLVGPLKDAVDQFTEITKAADKFFKTPVGQGVAAITAGMTALILVTSTFRAVSIKATAQLFAMRTAMISMGRAGDLAKGGIKNAIMTFLGLQKAVEMTSGEIQFLTRAQYETKRAAGEVATEVTKGSAVIDGFSEQSRMAAIRSKAFAAALTGIGIIGAVAGVAALVGTMQQLNDKTVDLAGSGGGLAAFRDAMYEDTKAVKAGESAYGSFKSSVTETKTVGADYIKTLEGVSGGQAKLNGDITELNSKITNQTLYLGENSKAWLANALANDEAVQDMFKNWEGGATGAKEALDSVNVDLEAMQEAALADPGTGALDYLKTKAVEFRTQFASMEFAANATGKSLEDIAKEWINDPMLPEAQKAAARMFLLASAMDTTTEAGAATSQMMSLLGISMPTDAVDDLTDSLDDTVPVIRTVIDYANDLAGVMDRVSQIRFGRQEELDSIATGWKSIKDEAADAKDAVKKANAELRELTADKSVLEYQLAVAKRYGDEKRAALIRAQLAKLNGQIADKQQDVTDAQQQGSTTLKGNTQAARDNRAKVLGMVGSYQSLIQTYVATGLRGKALEDKVKDLRAEFIQQAVDAGYARSELADYTGAFDDFLTTVQEVPENVTVPFNANISAAMQAINEFKAALDKVPEKITTTASIVIENPALQLLKMRDGFPNTSSMWTYYNGLYKEALKNTTTAEQLAITNYKNSQRGTGTRGGRAFGGIVTGPGSSTSDSIPMNLSNGEYVVQASAVKSYGVDFMNAINQQKFNGSMPRPAVAPTSSGGGSTVVYLSPEDRALLRKAIDRPIALYTENSKIAASANAGNVEFARRGTN